MIQLERASVEDAALFAALEQAPDTKEFILPYSPSEHVQKLLDPHLMYLRILQDGELAGFVILGLGPDAHSIEFRRIVVSSKGRGVGQSAISAMERFCRDELQRTRIWLDVFEHNRRGQHIYEKLGYKRYGASDHEGRRLLLYAKEL